MTRINSFVVVAVLLVISFAAVSLALPTFPKFQQKLSVSQVQKFESNLKAKRADESEGDYLCRVVGNAGCSKEGQACGCTSESNCRFCNDGLSCHDGFCEANSKLGESCEDESDCAAPADPSLDCEDDVCVPPTEIYHAGEHCIHDNALFENGGCQYGLTCDNSTQKCTPHYALGEDCSENEAGCGQGAFCSSQNKCVKSLGEGASCANETKRYGSESVCQASAICLDGTCQKLFSRNVDESCHEDANLCKAGLHCSTSVCKKTEGLNSRCGDDFESCQAGTICGCDYKTKTARCIGQFPAELIKYYKKYASCLDSNGLDASAPFFGSEQYEPSLLGSKCGHIFKQATVALHKGYYSTSKYCSSASSIVYSLPVIAMAVLAYFM